MQLAKKQTFLDLKVYDLKYDSKNSLIALWGYYLDTLNQGTTSEALKSAL